VFQDAWRETSLQPVPWLVCLDLQREFVISGRPLFAPESAQQLEVCKLVLSAARANGWGVTHCLTRRACGLFRAGSQFIRPIDGLEPWPDEVVIYREGLSAFSAPQMRRMAKVMTGADLLLIGFSLNESLLATALEAAELGLGVTLIEDAVGASRANAIRTNRLLAAARKLLEPLADFREAADCLAALPATPAEAGA
jgi:nicotinamidase-related amidase